MASGNFDDYLAAKAAAETARETSPETTAAAWKAFLETVPPNDTRDFSTTLMSTQLVAGVMTSGIFLPRLDLYCEEDSGVRRFSPLTTHLALKPNSHLRAFITFQCPDCRVEKKTYALDLVRAESVINIVKIGEVPAFGGPISKRLRRHLGRDLDLYRKGMRCEALGLGIGAASYFRRIVEKRWHKLVEEIRKVAEKLGETDLTDYDAALQETRFAAAVERLNDRIPAKLRLPSGDNPLLLLHGALSVGIHELSDADNLRQAEDIRVVMTELFEQLTEALASREGLTESIRRLKQPRPAKTK